MDSSQSPRRGRKVGTAGSFSATVYVVPDPERHRGWGLYHYRPDPPWRSTSQAFFVPRARPGAAGHGNPPCCAASQVRI